MKRILFMPFLQMSSGHHQVANGIIDSLQETNDLFECEKIDILSYSYGNVEGFISKLYLKWIYLFPNLYSWLYKKSAYKNEKEAKRFYFYEWLFLYWMKKLIKEKNPQLIICTHALPSYLLNHLKQKGSISVPVINVYTDYFINQIWGMECIDCHFVPTKEIKEVLIERGVKSDHILVTGIPIHPRYKEQDKVLHQKDKFSILISGGNLGIGLIKTFVETLQPSGKINYTVLCGENNKLYNWIKQLNNPFINAVPYISSKEEMNKLYDKVDAIITKPGGVTISECLFKRIPIFIYHELPGQEEINLQNLKKWGLVYHLDCWRDTPNFEEKILKVLHCDKLQKLLNQQLNTYHQHLSKEKVSLFIEKLLAENNIGK
ncbi:UDP-glucuronosyltransferase [Bacillus sp. Cr_A10]|uniref:MGDG synthase family glycosyltransferase n=1 Tax=Bacillus sp. Cr_A10 TaxID=3033993 RepID=UPI0023DBBF98|nr:UDP-glucuronosyltransferase [Bacillus sp. Cr_A10]MDF2066833.1 UDP-glucuronosyltransferase [Bacillus sp. Cr_A10]